MASPAAAAAHALLPALLKGAGYATAMAGKWGVGPSRQGIPGDLAAARFDAYLMHDAGLSEHNARDCGGDAHVDARVANPLATTTYLSRYWAPCYRRFPPDPATDSPLGYVRTTRADFGPDLEEAFVATFLGKQTPAKPFFLYYPTVLVHETENRTLPRADAPGDNGLKPTTDRLRPGGYWLARMTRLVERADVAVGRLRGALHSLINPAGTAISANRTRSEARRRSQLTAISSPMPTAIPSTAAIVGWGRSSRLRHMRWAMMWK